MPFKIHGKRYGVSRRYGKRADYTTFRFTPSKNGKAILFFGKLKKPRLSKRGKLQRWRLYEVLEPE